jgi:chaperonin GroES
MVSRIPLGRDNQGGQLRGISALTSIASGGAIEFQNGTNGGSKMTVNVTPLHDRVLVRRLEEKETAKGGIIIPDTAKEKPQEGEVIAVGAGKLNDEAKRIPLDVRPGDRILFGKYTGNDIKLDEQEYLILREEEILAKVSGMAKAASSKK